MKVAPTLATRRQRAFLATCTCGRSLPSVLAAFVSLSSLAVFPCGLSAWSWRAACPCGRALRFARVVCPCGVSFWSVFAVVSCGLPLRAFLAVCPCGRSLRSFSAVVLCGVCVIVVPCGVFRLICPGRHFVWSVRAGVACGMPLRSPLAPCICARFLRSASVGLPRGLPLRSCLAVVPRCFL